MSEQPLHSAVLDRIADAAFDRWRRDPRDLLCPHLDDDYDGPTVLSQGHMRCPACAEKAAPVECDGCGDSLLGRTEVCAVSVEYGDGGFVVDMRLCAGCRRAVTS
ncbi:hypothetical protein EEW87_004355 [Janibacter melonis]|uniref:Uncharacterized protein n=1 Tax=Janibacter melonis TaxID=262209 RepID=A0A5P8FKP5_9MICO|nr:hypothetical protein [Janibacter melonis]QFQ29731.1 hypothetical protein EEW87_004355 [Janibacter melonis]